MPVPPVAGRQAPSIRPAQAACAGRTWPARRGRPGTGALALVALALVLAVPAHAAFEAEGDHFDGTHVDLAVDAGAGVVCLLRLDGAGLLDQVAWPGMSADLRVSGSLLLLHQAAPASTSTPPPFEVPPASPPPAGGAGTSTVEPTGSSTGTGTASQTGTTTPTDTSSSTDTQTSEPTSSESTSTSESPTPTETSTSSESPSGSTTPTATETSTGTGTSTPTATGTDTPTDTPTETPTTTPSGTSTSSDAAAPPPGDGTQTGADQLGLGAGGCPAVPAPAGAPAAGPGSHLEVYDVRSGAIKLEARGANPITLRFPDGVRFEATSTTVRVTGLAPASPGGAAREAILWVAAGQATLGTAGSTVDVRVPSNADLLLRAIDPADPADRAIAAALADGRAVAEVSVRRQEDVVVEPGADADIAVTTRRSGDAITVTSALAGSQPRAIVLELGAGVHDGSASDLVVHLDGAELPLVPIGRALGEGGARGAAAAVVGGAATRVVVMVPPGTHTLRIEATAGAITADPVPLGGDEADVVVGAPRPVDGGDERASTIPGPPATAVAVGTLALAVVVVERRRRERV